MVIENHQHHFVRTPTSPDLLEFDDAIKLNLPYVDLGIRWRVAGFCVAGTECTAMKVTPDYSLMSTLRRRKIEIEYQIPPSLIVDIFTK